VNIRQECVAFQQEDILFTTLYGAFRRLSLKLRKNMKKMKKNPTFVEECFSHQNIQKPKKHLI
jgi:hypothetical protein